MQGMALARAYFAEYGEAMIAEKLSAYKPAMAPGLVGEGSECFGYDDQWSQDHDFGPGFCIWLPQALVLQAGEVIMRAYDALPKIYRGYERLETAQAGRRVGLWSIEGFYERYTGLTHPPRDNMEWFRIPETFLATCTNGEVFWDMPGLFSQWRNILLDFYPEEVVRKKLAARCALMAQSGQYNYGRSLRRGDTQAAYLACSLFVQHALGAIYLLNGRYMPYYKWAFRGAGELPLLHESVGKLVRLTQLPDGSEHSREKEDLIESVAVDIVRTLNARGFTSTSDAFLQVQGEALMRSITDSRLRALHIMADA